LTGSPNGLYWKLIEQVVYKVAVGILMTKKKLTAITTMMKMKMSRITFMGSKKTARRVTRTIETAGKEKMMILQETDTNSTRSPTEPPFKLKELTEHEQAQPCVCQRVTLLSGEDNITSFSVINSTFSLRLPQEPRVLQ
jgi:hypothetical protein